MHLRPLFSRWSKVVVALVAGIAFVGLTGVTSAVAAADSAHPYSDPVFFPMHGPVVIGCTGTDPVNNGPTTGHNPCATDHDGYFAMNIGVPYKVGGVLNPVPHPAVYAAGAGVVMSVTTGAPSCATSGAVSGGNSVWINHGGGIVSVYQHLQTVAVKVNGLVTPRTVIGTAGSTGSRCQSDGTPVTAYLDFQLRRYLGSNEKATTTAITSLFGCTGSSTRGVAWPAGLPRSAYARPGGAAMPTTLPTTWVKVPYDVVVTFPATTWACLHASGDGTPSRAAVPHSSRSGTHATISWSSVAGANRYDVQLQVESGSTWIAPCSASSKPGCNYGFYTAATASSPKLALTGLTSSRHYRVRLSTHNAFGWGLASAWKTI